MFQLKTMDFVYFPIPSINDLMSHIIFTLFFTVLWVYIYRHRSFSFLSFAMFFPSIFAIFIHMYHGSLTLFISFLLLKPQWLTVYWSIVSGFISIFTVLICCLINYLIGWAQFCSKSSSFSSVHQHNRNLAFGWLRAMGEEIGWRSYLLPGLLIHFRPIIALNISGLVWGLYHVPVMILLCYDTQSKVQYPIRVITVQFLSCWISAFCYGWIGIQCQYSIIPPTMAHFIWNQVNPFILGSIYTNTPGLMYGEQWKINGEGLMGCIVYFVIAIIIVLQLN